MAEPERVGIRIGTGFVGSLGVGLRAATGFFTADGGRAFGVAAADFEELVMPAGLAVAVITAAGGTVAVFGAVPAAGFVEAVIVIDGLLLLLLLLFGVVDVVVLSLPGPLPTAWDPAWPFFEACS